MADIIVSLQVFHGWISMFLIFGTPGLGKQCGLLTHSTNHYSRHRLISPLVNKTNRFISPRFLVPNDTFT